MPEPYTFYLMTFTTAMLVAGVLGLYGFIGKKNLKLKTIKNGLRDNWKFAIVLILIFSAIIIENYTHPYVSEYLVTNYTDIISQIGLGGEDIAAMQSMATPFQIHIFILIYLYVYTFLLIFTPLMLIFTNDKKMMKLYTMAILINYLILIPFYVLVPVETPGYYMSEKIQPLLYSNPTYHRFISGIDPMDNCFPSGHVSVAVTIFLLFSMFAKKRIYKKYTIFAAISAFLISISILYLGIHWTIDIVGGFMLAIASVCLAKYIIRMV